jgi:ankyrin repeat protein
MLFGMGALPAQDLFDAVRSGDPSRVETALRAGANIQARDPKGATPLMYAIQYGNLETVRLLLARGADVNAQANSGRTALMMAIAWPEKARLLLAAGADVSLAAKDGTTPLRAAARSSPDLALELLAKGAKPTRGVLTSAAGNGYDGLLRALMTQWRSSFTTEDLAAALTAAASNGEIAGVRTLIEAGAPANPKPGNTTGAMTPLMAAAFSGSAELTKYLLEQGADPNVSAFGSYTPLQMAAGTEYQSPEVIRLLLASGAKRDAKDQDGYDAGAWASRRADPAAVRLLDAKVATGGDAMKKAPIPPAREAVQKAIRLLQPAGKAFTDKNPCTSCHHQSLLQVAIASVRGKGIEIDEALRAQQQKVALERWAVFEEGLLYNGTVMGGFVANTTYGLLGLHASGHAPDTLTDAVAHALGARQANDGSFDIRDTRPPLGIGPIHWTALALRALQLYAPQGGVRADYEKRIERAGKYLAAAKPDSTQDLVFQILGLHWAGIDTSRQTRELLKLQRPGGGWGQRPELQPDAYATAQALWPLREGAGRSANDAAYRRGVRYLLTTQKPDGSWHVRNRAFGFQPRHDTGFPHGKDQWISAAATALAVTALAPVVEPVRSGRAD